MGVINVTPDSFYPGSRAATPKEAAACARRMKEEGADILDVGGQSTRPGSEPVPLAEELRRVVPAVRAAAEETGLPVSVDTDKAEVARLARLAGASILNDVSALRAEPELAHEAAKFDAVVLMHRLGESSKTMQDSPRYADVVAEVRDFLAARLEAFVQAGGDRARALIDPGIGFGKTPAHNLSLLKHLDAFARLAPVVLGASRKSFLGAVIPDEGPDDRLPGSLAAALCAAASGAAAVRVHDVDQTRRALATFWAVRAAC
ncbi:MAG: dihydropteroate synthase [Elusimicrobia bacterium]|nr:dihydropteroate synthase [Elusimicrobiota bacterium]MDE2313129.1 dihydropteroate synthase [Elusimicrobiota bacterium]